MPEKISGAPRVTDMKVIPVAGQDSMLLNLSGAHAPYFTRNLVILTDSAGNSGVGEVPGGEKIRQTLEDSRDLVIGAGLGTWNNILSTVGRRFADRDSGGRGLQTFDLRTTVHVQAALECALVGPVGPASGCAGRGAVGRRPAARPGGDAGLSLLHRRPQKDQPALSPRSRRAMPGPGCATRKR